MLTPLALAIIIGTFWAGVGTAAVVSNDGWNHGHRQDVVISATTDDHISACHARYRSYQEDTDMWLGHDGNWHQCQL